MTPSLPVFSYVRIPVEPHLHARFASPFAELPSPHAGNRGLKSEDPPYPTLPPLFQFVNKLILSPPPLENPIPGQGQDSRSVQARSPFL